MIKHLCFAGLRVADMRIGHFEALRPVCPRCKAERQTISPLMIENVIRRQNDIIVDGNLACSEKHCGARYPIIDGIPIVVSNLNQYINSNFYHITVRSDLSSAAQAILGDIAGPGSEFNLMRHYLSVYSWDHYGDKAPGGEFAHLSTPTVPGSVANCLNAGLSLLKDPPQAPVIDIGCAVGRCSFELAARHAGLVLGVDLNFSLLRVAQRILRDGCVVFPLKRSGVVYERHEYDLAFENQQCVDFWACDALALPFEENSFYFASALNVFDAVSAPRKLLVSIRDALKPGGSALFATPYDWTTQTPMQNWIGGHSQLDPESGSPEMLMKKLLSTQASQAIGNFSLAGEIENHPWNLRVHDRHNAHYHVHIFACGKT